jgi:hypothetical protein
MQIVENVIRPASRRSVTPSGSREIVSALVKAKNAGCRSSSSTRVDARLPPAA